MKTIELTNEAPERLDKVLSQILDVSRSKIQKIIKDGHVTVNGDFVPTKHLVDQSDNVEVNMEELTPKKTQQIPPNLNILFEDDDVLVINKPAGLLVHETETSNEPTLVAGLIAHDSKIKDVGDNRNRAGLVHRLDKHASGVIITAKNQETFQFLKEQFKNRQVKKKYTVLVHGQLEEPHGTIALPISRAKSTGRMAAKPPKQGGRDAITHYELIEQFPHHALLDVTIETGRTHQIRAHFFAKGHPVAGDVLYKQRNQKLLDIGRIFLHARELTISTPTEKEKIFTAPLPKELEHVLENIPKT